MADADSSGTGAGGGPQADSSEEDVGESLFATKARGGRLALDIETISPDVPIDERPDFGDSSQFELLCTALGYEPPDEGSHTEGVIFRESHTRSAEVDHLYRVAKQIIDLDPETIITFGGEEFDFNHLQGRASILSDTLDEPNLPSVIADALGRADHLDLQPSAWDAYGTYTSLEHTCHENGLKPRETRFDLYDHGHPLSHRDDPDNPVPGHVESGDVPEIGEALLRHWGGERDGDAGRINPDEAASMLGDYARGDIAHLFALADRHPFGGE
jgi:hypothetical protein